VSRKKPKGRSKANSLPKSLAAVGDDSPARAAARAAASLEIMAIRFVNFSAATSHRVGGSLPTTVTPKIGFTKPSFRRFDQNSIAIDVTFLFKLSADGAEPVFHFRCETELVYVVRADTIPLDSDLEHFALVNAPFNAWGYWREAVQSSMSKLDLPVFPIPLFRIADVHSMVLGDEEMRKR